MIVLPKNKKKLSRMQMIAGVAVVAIIIATLALSFNPNVLQNQISSASQYNCGTLQINIQYMKEAIAYYRNGISKPSGTNYKYEIIDMSTTNYANSFQDLSGYRLKLVANDGTVIAPTQFGSIEKITYGDNTAVDFNCTELALASISRFGLNASQSARGCKIFLMLSNLTPASLQVYNVTGLQCTVYLG